MKTETAAILREAAIIFAAAMCLGIAYNATSPLGVHAAPSAGGDVAASEPAVPVPPSVPDPALDNETISAALFSIPAGTAQPPAEKQLLTTLAWPEVKALLAQGQITLVDARDSLSYEAGHIPGAVSLPGNMLDDKMGEFAAHYAKTTPLVIYCASIRCGLAHFVARALIEKQGYSNVREMPGGYAEWMLAESKPVTTAESR
jgi:rhodanese-related sulfurtransferase